MSTSQNFRAARLSALPCLLAAGLTLLSHSAAHAGWIEYANGTATYTPATGSVVNYTANNGTVTPYPSALQAGSGTGVPDIKGNDRWDMSLHSVYTFTASPVGPGHPADTLPPYEMLLQTGAASFTDITTGQPGAMVNVTMNKSNDGMGDQAVTSGSKTGPSYSCSASGNHIWQNVSTADGDTTNHWYAPLQPASAPIVEASISAAFDGNVTTTLTETGVTLLDFMTQYMPVDYKDSNGSIGFGGQALYGYSSLSTLESAVIWPYLITTDPNNPFEVNGLSTAATYTFVPYGASIPHSPNTGYLTNVSLYINKSLVESYTYHSGGTQYYQCGLSSYTASNVTAAVLMVTDSTGYTYDITMH